MHQTHKTKKKKTCSYRYRSGSAGQGCVPGHLSNCNVASIQKEEAVPHFGIDLKQVANQIHMYIQLATMRQIYISKLECSSHNLMRSSARQGKPRYVETLTSYA